MKTLRLLSVGLLLGTMAAMAPMAQAQGRYGTSEFQYNPAASNRDILNRIGIEQKLGAPLPLDTQWRDEEGNPVKLGDYFKPGKPVLLAPVFYKCEGTCLLVAEGVLKAVNRQKRLMAGRDFEIVFFSINPKETPELAKGKKNLWVKDYKWPEAKDGWHVLTGRWEDITRLTDAIGFKFDYDKENDRITHPGMILIATPDGRASEYLTGVSYAQKDVFDGLMAASQNEIGRETELVLMGCIEIDPKSGQMRLNVERTLQVAGVATALVLFASIAMMAFRYRSKPLTEADLEGFGGPGEPRN